MKNIKIISSTVLFALGSLLFSPVQAQKLEKATVQNMVESKHFVFKAQTMLPAGGAVRQLTSEYDLRLSGDTLSTYLPYFGRAYAPILPGEGGINFTSTKFDYKAKENKKGGWDIVIKPRDTREVREVLLNVSENGFAFMQVISNNKQNISFNGYLDEKK